MITSLEFYQFPHVYEFLKYYDIGGCAKLPIFFFYRWSYIFDRTLVVLISIENVCY